MAKIALSKLNLKTDTSVNIVKWEDQEIEVKKYLPFNQKLVLIAAAVANCQDPNNFKNDAKLDCCLFLGILKYYTNITITEKQEEDLGKLYDLFASTGLAEKIIETMGDEYTILYRYMNSIMDNLYEYRNSAYGILDAIRTDYSDLDFDINKIQDDLRDENNLTFLKDVLNKLG